MNTVTAVAGALLNTLWQATLLALLVWLGTSLARERLNAATRAIVWWIALAVVLLLPCVPRRVPTPMPPQPRPATAAPFPVRVAPPFATPASEAPVNVPQRRNAVWPVCLLAVWAAFGAHRLIGVLRSYIRLRGIKRRSVVCARLLPGLRRSARLMASSEISSPAAAGFHPPAIILPERLRERLTDSEMECVLLHESAHLARYDDWENIVAQVAAAVIGLHPVAWWILRQIEREREMACDDWVVVHSGAARSYAESLVRLAEWRLDPADAVLASGIFTRRSRLRERVEALVRRGRKFSPVVARAPLGAAAMALASLAIAGALAPHWIAFAQRPEFEVASIKEDKVAQPFLDSVPHRSGTLVTMHNTRAYTMIYYAYHLSGDYQIVGYPMTADGLLWWDLDARAPEDATDDQIRLMFQSLLADRFKLKAHRETRDIPEYELTLGKSKPKLTPASADRPMTVTIEDRTFTPAVGGCSVSLWREGAHMLCHAAPIEKIAAQVRNSLRSPLVDRTGLTGTYDLNLLYMPEGRTPDPDQVPAPTLPEALKDVGLNLEKGKGPVEVLVIDHIERPSEN